MIDAAFRAKDEAIADEVLSRSDITELISRFPECDDYMLMQDPVAFAVYLQMREKGGSHRLCLMEACRTVPGVKNSDRNFNDHARARMNRMSPKNRERIVREAKRAGVNVQGKFYVGGLGRYTDQAAWVSTADDIITVAKQRNLNVTGAVNHQAINFSQPPKRTRLAPTLVREFEQKYLKNDPALREKVKKNPKERIALRERIIDTHSKPKPE